ncbi:hypothetical protein [Alkalihalobacterium chitinilyticum]|uniref:Type II toxin-antitoxin system RelE/ParE family toxin n=1 Tax=Alkalihalobacterium chitinilyticum TaxID=2980103 RepID=A0ABT5VFP1_9BACI|nr:hypothetical protein [Alkalihalobacterium chitinilyticum]MDE5413986.1 hypothetical protein [Alkalihalobacterium chitinilyticum]
MTVKELYYDVVWGQKARVWLAEMKPFKINPKLVFRNSKVVLSVDPRQKAYDVVDYPGFQFNGYYWTYINNVIIVYDVLDKEKKVLVDACYSALTGFTLETFYGENDRDPL